MTSQRSASSLAVVGSASEVVSVQTARLPSSLAGESEFVTEPFVKLAGQALLLSTVWQESAEVRCLWVALLALADSGGTVRASVPGLASIARIELSECERGLEIFCAPDRYSRSREDEGRRIRRVEGGFFIINYLRYRNRRTENQVRNASRQKKFREQQALEEQRAKGAGE